MQRVDEETGVGAKQLMGGNRLSRWRRVVDVVDLRPMPHSSLVCASVHARIRPAAITHRSLSLPLLSSHRHSRRSSPPMSQSKNNQTSGQAAQGSVSSRKRRQMRIRARAEAGDDGQDAAQSRGHASPAMRIYRHALESIFEMLQLGDLTQLLAVSRAWAAVVRSMKPIDAAIERVDDGSDAFRPLPPIASIVSSPLLRHVSAIHIRGDYTDAWTPLNTESLGLLAQHASSLTSLWCALTLTLNEPVVLPAKLHSLKLQLDGEYTDDASNGVLRALAALPSLSRLSLTLSFDAALELSILAASQSLIELELPFASAFTPIQMEQIRSALGHLRHLSIGRFWTSELEDLLQPPVTARWQDIGLVGGDARAGELLLNLPSLTKLHLSYYDRIRANEVEFLPQLPQLTVLHLDCDSGRGEEGPSPADAVLASLVRCRGIIDLSLNCGFTSAHWSALFDKLTRIRKLMIFLEDGETLQCFTAGPITQSLEELSIQGFELPPSEITNLYALRHLRTLDLDESFSPRLDAGMLDSHSPPTAHFPSLIHFRCLCADAVGGAADRRGPSFEWMQARVMQ